MSDTEWLKDEYGPRIQSFLRSVAKAAHERGYALGSVDEWWDDDYAWDLLIQTPAEAEESKAPGNDVQGVDVKITIAESEHWDGSEGGVNFMLDINDVGGSILGGCIPCNYSDDVWVRRDDRAAVRERFEDDFYLDAGQVLDVINQHHGLEDGQLPPRVVPDIDDASVFEVDAP